MTTEGLGIVGAMQSDVRATSEYGGAQVANVVGNGEDMVAQFS